MFIIKLANNILDKIDERKKVKAMKTVGLYIDRHGNKWFDTSKYCAFGKHRKWC